uniref:single-strand selective monofunctional uracil DNA glycosylase-like n=1 Tax=Styela clava TaxID=7725 RepID=UPI00193A29CD|nr:single-strand selective monofunctional uracil DNA glycosylase-like [Styela clava]
MDQYFHGVGAKRQFHRDCDISSVPGAIDFASFSQLASQQAVTKQAALAGVMQEYMDDRWKDRQVGSAAVFPGSTPTPSRVLYNNNDEMAQAAHSLLMAQHSVAADLDAVAAAQAASRNFMSAHIADPLTLSHPHDADDSPKEHLTEDDLAHDNVVANFLSNPQNQQQLEAALDLHQQQQELIGSADSTLAENEEDSFNAQIVQAFLWIEAKLCAKLKCVKFSDKVEYVYNPLEYASDPHAHYVSKYSGTKAVLFLGMNPGPYGMAQNGVPFGDTRYVRDWLKITGAVHHPPHEHPRRIIQGLDCTRSEVSGARFWGFIAKICGTPEQFFRHCFVHNYCPLTFMTKSGKNIIPAALPATERRNLEAICDEALLQCIRVIRAQIIVAIGKYAADRVTCVLQSAGDESAASIRIVRILHPSPASPQANRGWEEVVTQQLQESGIIQYLQSPG